MTQILADIHNHSDFCDGKSTPAEMAASAFEKGFSDFGFSGHSYAAFDLPCSVRDEEGYIAVLGRTKELIKCSGYSVFPTEVEELLYRHPAIIEVAVIGIPDPYRGQATKAFIVLRPEHKGKVTEKDIAEWTKDNMATYKRPRIIEFRDTLPKSAAGKILRRVLSDEEKENQNSSGT